MFLHRYLYKIKIKAKYSYTIFPTRVMCIVNDVKLRSVCFFLCVWIITTLIYLFWSGGLRSIYTENFSIYLFHDYLVSLFHSRIFSILWIFLSGLPRNVKELLFFYRYMYSSKCIFNIRQNAFLIVFKLFKVP